MTNDLPIDTSSLLTILGVIAAVWAIIPTDNRLRFRLSITWYDWLIVVIAFLAIHYLVFERVLRVLGLYYVVGPWKWGLDKGSAVYLLLLGLGLYLLVRARAPKLARQNVEIFGRLVDNLLLTSRYDELTSLVEPQLSKLLKISMHRPLLSRIIGKIMPPESIIDIEALMHGMKPRREATMKRWLRSKLSRLEAVLVSRDRSSQQARELLQNISNSPSLVAYLAVAHPSFCLRLVERPEVVREDFLEIFMDALLADHTSRIYIELKNNENLNGRHRLALPESNRILCFFFKDVSVAAVCGLYRAIGEAVCRKLDDDQRLAETYNRSLGYYQEVGKYHCPIHAGIKLFEIMVHEAIHQGLQDHLWLFYFTHFTDGILAQMRDLSPDDENHEFPTPFYFLLYEIVSITSNWVDDGLEVKEASIPEEVRGQQGFDLFYISEQATDALGTIIRDIIQSPKIADRFKGYVLVIALRRYKRIQNETRMGHVADSFVRSLIDGINLSTKLDYRRDLSEVFHKLDHVLRREVPKFAESLDTSLSRASP